MGLLAAIQKLFTRSTQSSPIPNVQAPPRDPEGDPQTLSTSLTDSPRPARSLLDDPSIQLDARSKRVSWTDWWPENFMDECHDSRTSNHPSDIEKREKTKLRLVEYRERIRRGLVFTAQDGSTPPTPRKKGRPQL